MASLAAEEDEDDNEFVLHDAVSLEPLHNSTENYPQGQPIYLFCRNGHSFNRDTLVNLLLDPKTKYDTNHNLVEYAECPECRDNVNIKGIDDFMRNRGLEKQIEELRKQEQQMKADMEKKLQEKQRALDAEADEISKAMKMSMLEKEKLLKQREAVKTELQLAREQYLKCKDRYEEAKKNLDNSTAILKIKEGN